MASSALEGKFIQFGCWNQGLCTTEDSAAASEPTSITRVMRTLKNYITDPNNKPEFIVVAGDNYYPRKKTGEVEKTILFLKVSRQMV